MLGFCDSPESAGGTDKVPLLMKNRFKGVDAEEISDMMRFSHAALLKNFCESYDKGENTSFIATIATTPQLRMTRRIVGAYTLDESEVHTRMDDSIGLVSDWRKRGPVFEIPFGTLWGRDVKNLITAGRCISVTDDMWDITRVIPDCAVTGEAAGVAAAMSDDFATLDIAALQNELRSRGVKIHETEV